MDRDGFVSVHGNIVVHDGIFYDIQRESQTLDSCSGFVLVVYVCVRIVRFCPFHFGY